MAETLERRRGLLMAPPILDGCRRRWPGAVALLALLAGCGGVAGADLFAPSPLTPPGLCPASAEGDCSNVPTGPLTLVPVSSCPDAGPANGETDAPPDATPPDAGDGGLSVLSCFVDVVRG